MSNNIKTQIGRMIGETLNSYHSKVKPTIDDLKFRQEYQDRIIECMVGEVDDSYIETPETNEPVVKLEHSREGLVKVPSVKGKTILVDADGNETDTPAEGCKLVSVGEDEDNKLIILSNNKNLFDMNELIKGVKEKGKFISYENGILTYRNTVVRTVVKNFNPYGDVYVKFEHMGNIEGHPNIGIEILFENGTRTYLMNGYNTGVIYQRYINQGVKIKNISWVYADNGTNAIRDIIVSQEPITEYVQHKQHKTEILLNEPLRSLPNGVCDEIVGNKLIRRIGKVVLDGKNVTSIGIINDNIVDVLYLDKTVTNKKFINYGSEGQQLIKSNIYRTGINANNWNSTTSENTLVNTSLNGFWIFLPKFTVLNIEDAINYMNDNPTEVIYELEEPIIEELPNSITLQGFDDTTMYIENSIIPTVSYGYNALIPYKEELSNQKEEVEVNTLDIENNIIPYLMDMEFNLMLMEDN